MWGKGWLTHWIDKLIYHETVYWAVLGYIGMVMILRYSWNANQNTLRWFFFDLLWNLFKLCKVDMLPNPTNTLLCFTNHWIQQYKKNNKHGNTPDVTKYKGFVFLSINNLYCMFWFLWNQLILLLKGHLANKLCIVIWFDRHQWISCTAGLSWNWNIYVMF